MEKIIFEHISNLQFGDLQIYENMAVVPILSELDGSPQYLTLKESLEKQFLTVTEIDQGGSVPELKVIINADIPILVLDGEELVGAKQNRIINISILFKERSEVVVPVSCTESGRWSYTSDEFEDSKTMASPKLRYKTSRSVSKSLNIDQTRTSDQREVWSEIDDMHRSAGTFSKTSSMKDVFDSRSKDISEYMNAFIKLPSQKGMLAFINGEVGGMDYISLETAYSDLHQKLIKSYAMEAILCKGDKKSEPTIEKAKSFIEKIKNSKESKFDSLGYGSDYRFEGDRVIGTTLVHQEKVIHLAFFSISDNDATDEKTNKMSSFRERRNFRR